MSIINPLRQAGYTGIIRHDKEQKINTIKDFQEKGIRYTLKVDPNNKQQRTQLLLRKDYIEFQLNPKVKANSAKVKAFRDAYLEKLSEGSPWVAQLQSCQQSLIDQSQIVKDLIRSSLVEIQTNNSLPPSERIDWAVAIKEKRDKLQDLLAFMHTGPEAVLWGGPIRYIAPIETKTNKVLKQIRKVLLLIGFSGRPSESRNVFVDYTPANPTPLQEAKAAIIEGKKVSTQAYKKLMYRDLATRKQGNYIKKPSEAVYLAKE